MKKIRRYQQKIKKYDAKLNNMVECNPDLCRFPSAIKTNLQGLCNCNNNQLEGNIGALIQPGTGCCCPCNNKTECGGGGVMPGTGLCAPCPD